jgi:hypothetical protein
MKWFLRTRRVRGWGVSIRFPIRTSPGEGRCENWDISGGRSRWRKERRGRRKGRLVTGDGLVWTRGSAVIR